MRDGVKRALRPHGHDCYSLLLRDLGIMSASQIHILQNCFSFPSGLSTKMGRTFWSGSEMDLRIGDRRVSHLSALRQIEERRLNLAMMMRIIKE